jgi:hypothetical protein
MYLPQIRLARALHHEWRLLPERERARLAPLARDVKELALDVRGTADPARALSELTVANEAFATSIIEAAGRAPDVSDEDFDWLREHIRAQQYHAAALVHAA